MVVKVLIIDTENNRMDVFREDMKVKKEEIRISNVIDEMIKFGVKEGLFNDEK